MPEASKRMAVLFVFRYPAWAAFFGMLSMAFFRLPLWLNRRLSFWRLMGSGRNGTFDIIPDFRHWAILVVYPDSLHHTISETNDVKVLSNNILGGFIASWILFFKAEAQAILLSPEEGHGLWNGQPVFGELARKAADWDGPIAVMTRATIRLSRAKQFWRHVNAVADQMAEAPGFITSYGIGEVPFIKQATFSIWESKEAMYEFAYKMPQHKEVIRKTYAEKWYSEDMFTRFRILKVWNLSQLERQLWPTTV
jgi:heme-degrading monooxygenase HmoA